LLNAHKLAAYRGSVVLAGPHDFPALQIDDRYRGPIVRLSDQFDSGTWGTPFRGVGTIEAPDAA